MYFEDHYKKFKIKGSEATLPIIQNQPGAISSSPKNNFYLKLL